MPERWQTSDEGATDVTPPNVVRVHLCTDARKKPRKTATGGHSAVVPTRLASSRDSSPSPLRAGRSDVTMIRRAMPKPRGIGGPKGHSILALCTVSRPHGTTTASDEDEIDESNPPFFCEPLRRNESRTTRSAISERASVKQRGADMKGRRWRKNSTIWSVWSLLTVLRARSFRFSSITKRCEKIERITPAGPDRSRVVRFPQ